MSNNLILPTLQANIRASEGAGTTTLEDKDNRWQIFNLSAARTCQLPSAGIKAGEVFRIENKGAFDLSFQSSNAVALTVANGINIEATIRIGYVVLMALQDSPTTPAHWRVHDVYEEITHTLVWQAAIPDTTTTTNKFIRTNKIVTGNIAAFSNTANATSQLNSSSASAVPVRFRPLTGGVVGVPRTRNGANSTLLGGMLQVTTSGTFGILRGEIGAPSFTNGLSVDLWENVVCTYPCN